MNWADIVEESTKGTKIFKLRHVFARKASGLAKARICLKDFSKFKNPSNHSPVSEDISFKILCDIVGKRDLDMHQFDVCQAFLHADINEDVYMNFPEGYISPKELQNTSKEYVLKANKALYGKQNASKLWY